MCVCVCVVWYSCVSVPSPPHSTTSGFGHSVAAYFYAPPFTSAATKARMLPCCRALEWPFCSVQASLCVVEKRANFALGPHRVASAANGSCGPPEQHRGGKAPYLESDRGRAAWVEVGWINQRFLCAGSAKMFAHRFY